MHMFCLPWLDAYKKYLKGRRQLQARERPLFRSWLEVGRGMGEGCHLQLQGWRVFTWGAGSMSP